jgi:hypothetical protein
MDWASGEKPTATKLNGIRAYCHVYQTSVQTLTTAVQAVINFQSEAYDPFGWHSTSLNIARVIPNIPGTYSVKGMVAYAVNATGDRTAHIKKNGAALDSMPYGGQRASSTSLASGMAYAMGGTVAMNGTTDYLELYGIQNSGGNLNTYYAPSENNSFMIVKRIGD